MREVTFPTDNDCHRWPYRTRRDPEHDLSFSGLLAENVKLHELEQAMFVARTVANAMRTRRSNIYKGVGATAVVAGIVGMSQQSPRANLSHASFSYNAISNAHLAKLEVRRVRLVRLHRPALLHDHCMSNAAHNTRLLARDAPRKQRANAQFGAVSKTYACLLPSLLHVHSRFHDQRGLRDAALYGIVHLCNTPTSFPVHARLRTGVLLFVCVCCSNPLAGRRGNRPLILVGRDGCRVFCHPQTRLRLRA